MNVVELRREKERVISENKLMFLLKEKSHEGSSSGCECRVCSGLLQLDKMLVEINTLIRVARGIPKGGAITNKKEKLDRLKKIKKLDKDRVKKVAKKTYKNKGDAIVKEKVRELMREGLEVNEISERLNEPYGNVYYHFKNIEKEGQQELGQEKEEVSNTKKEGEDGVEECRWILKEVVDLLGDDIMIKVNESIVESATDRNYERVKRLGELAIKLNKNKGSELK